jgi:hypothetical protein
VQDGAVRAGAYDGRVGAPLAAMVKVNIGHSGRYLVFI